jgi:hemolysin activation/secretion protein
MRIYNQIFIALLAITLLPLSSWAAVPISNSALPSTVIPNQQEKSLRELPKPLSKPLLRKSPPPVAPQVKIDESNTTELYLLKKITLKGNTAISTAVLEKYYLPLLNTKVSENTILNIVQSLTQYYQSEGYTLSFAQVYMFAKQEGIVGIELVERKLNNVELQGFPELTELPIVVKTKQEILDISPFRQQDLEKVLLTLRSLPNITVSSFLQESNDISTDTSLSLALEKGKSWTGRSGIDNYGSNFSGPWSVNTSVSRNGVFNPLDSISGTFQTATDSQESLYGSVGYSRPVGTGGTMMNIAAARTWSEPGYTLKDAGIESINSSIVVNFQYPFLRTRDRNITLSGGTAIRNAQTKSLGTLIGRDKVRSVNAGGSYDWVDSTGGATLLQTQFSQGIPILGGTANNNALASRANGRVDFSKITGYASRSQPLPKDFNLLVITEGQYALTQLLSIEEYAYGGRQFGRGYNGGEISGDNGFAALIEIQRPFTTRLPSTIVNNTQLFASYDFGSVWRIDTDTRESQQTGASVATGVRMGLWKSTRLDLQVAAPLTRGSSATSEEDAKNWRGFFSLSVGW